MAKKSKKSPKTTLWVPPNEECPDDWTVCYEQVREDIVLEIIQNQVAQGIERAVGLQNLQWDLHIQPVKAEIITPYNRYEFEWPSEDWPCLDGFLRGLRHRLDELLDSIRDELEVSLRSEIDLEDIGKQAWNTFVLPRLQDIRDDERQFGAERAREQTLSGLLGLERGTLARGQLERIARTRLSGWDSPDFKDFVHKAREMLTNE